MKPYFGVNDDLFIFNFLVDLSFKLALDQKYSSKAQVPPICKKVQYLNEFTLESTPAIIHSCDP